MLKVLVDVNSDKSRDIVGVLVPSDTSSPVLTETLVTVPFVLLVPAPIKLRISAAVIPLAKEGVDPFVVIAASETSIGPVDTAVTLPYASRVI